MNLNDKEIYNDSEEKKTYNPLQTPFSASFSTSFNTPRVSESILLKISNFSKLF